MLNLKPIALVGGTVVCAVGFLLFIPLITELFYQSESWQSYAVPILIYLIVGGSLVITNRNIELNLYHPKYISIAFDETHSENHCRTICDSISKSLGKTYTFSNTIPSKVDLRPLTFMTQPIFNNYHNLLLASLKNPTLYF